MSKHIGPYEIDEISSEGDFVHVTFQEKDGVKPPAEKFPQYVYEELVKDEPTDLSTYREDRCFPIVREVLQKLLDANIKFEDYKFILDRVNVSLEETYKTALDNLWGKDRHDVTVGDIQGVLTVGAKAQEE